MLSIAWQARMPLWRHRGRCAISRGQYARVRKRSRRLVIHLRIGLRRVALPVLARVNVHGTRTVHHGLKLSSASSTRGTSRWADVGPRIRDIWLWNGDWMKGLCGLGSKRANFVHAGRRVLGTANSESFARHEFIQSPVVGILADAWRILSLLLFFSTALL